MYKATYCWLFLLLVNKVCRGYYFLESFDETWEKRWKYSEDDKYNGEAEIGIPPTWNESGLKLPSNARHYGLSALTDNPVDPSKGLIIQYEVKVSQDGWSCGGAYLKFLTYDPSFKQQDLVDATPYTIMFGPDKCGGTNKVHFILKYKSPKTGEVEEKYLESPPSVDSSKFTSVYTLILNPDNTFKVLVNDEEKADGNLHDNFTPTINPPQEIDDPDDSKPEDWVDDPKIVDPDATKPEDWDEDAPEYVDDPDATKPDGWDDEEDGDWTPPQIMNPEYKGKWEPSMIDNPDYQGPWEPRKIPNPDYFNDEKPLTNIGKIGGVALEVWTMDRDFYFDNILITDNELEASQYRKIWKTKRDAEEAAKLSEDKQVLREASSGPARIIRQVVDAATFLDPYRGEIDPYLDILDVNHAYAYAVIGVPVGFLSIVLLVCLFSGRKSSLSAAEARRTKKEDEPSPDDEVEEKEGEEQQEEEGEEEEADEDDNQGAKKRRTARVS